MTTLVTGGTGKTGLILAKLLTDAGYPALLTSRKGEAPAPFKAVKFDWYDQSTFGNPFDADASIDRVYLIAPHDAHPGPIVKPFLDLAISKGVKRFVLLGGSGQTSKDIALGEVQKLLEEADPGVDYAILKATWFQENFATYLYYGLQEKNAIFSCVGDGLLPFISTRDIAQVAFDTLTVDKLGRQELALLGPELLTYDDAAKLLSPIIGREITHIRFTPEQMKGMFTLAGLSDELADYLVSLEQETAAGKEERLFKSNDPSKRVGKHTLLEYFKENKEIWAKP